MLLCQLRKAASKLRDRASAASVHLGGASGDRAQVHQRGRLRLQGMHRERSLRTSASRRLTQRQR
eukprot:6879105-Alexandrium_andersonii.AAC.1